jgi:hypothetical protein
MRRPGKNGNGKNGGGAARLPAQPSIALPRKKKKKERSTSQIFARKRRGQQIRNRRSAAAARKPELDNATMAMILLQKALAVLVQKSARMARAFSCLTPSSAIVFRLSLSSLLTPIVTAARTNAPARCNNVPPPHHTHCCLRDTHGISIFAHKQKIQSTDINVHIVARSSRLRVAICITFWNMSNLKKYILKKKC